MEAHPADSGIGLRVVRGPTAPGLGDLVAEVGEEANNTVTRAARAFFAATGLAPAVSLVLTKSIPAGTGLGGASSDAAGTLAALNALHGRPLERDRLTEIGGTIGADVPFFCSGHATALAWGRGDRLLGCPPPPAATVVIAVPEVRIATADAYRDIASTLDLPAPPMRLPDLAGGGWPAISAMQINDFEPGAFARFPVLAQARADARERRGHGRAHDRQRIGDLRRVHRSRTRRRSRPPGRGSERDQVGFHRADADGHAPCGPGISAPDVNCGLHHVNHGLHDVAS